MPGETATLLGRETSQLLNILRIGVSVNNCSVKLSCSSNNGGQADKKAALKAKYPKDQERQNTLKAKYPKDQERPLPGLHPTTLQLLRRDLAQLQQTMRGKAREG